MKPDLFTAVMKTIGSTQDENIRTAIDSALDTLNEKANQNAEATINNALEAFSKAKSAHTENMLKLNDIDAAITRSEKERQNALNESAEAEQNWRTRFRELRGMMTPELKAEHSQRVAGRELAEEFTALIDELNDDKASTMLAACTSGDKYVGTHFTVFSAYSRTEGATVMKDIPPSLVRAFALTRNEGRRTPSQRSHSGAGGECTGAKQILHIQHGAGAGNFKNWASPSGTHRRGHEAL